MTRLLRLAALVGALAALATAAGCGGGGSDSARATVGDPVGFEQLAAAATTSAQASSGRFAFSLQVTMPGAEAPFAFSGEGAFDATANRASLSLDFSAFAGLLGGLFAGFGATGTPPELGDAKDWRLEAVQDGLVMYLRLPAVSDELPAGKSWVRLDVREAGAAQGFDFSQLQDLTSTDPRKMLDFLRAASGRVETLGTDSLRGVETTHHRATLDLREYDRLVPEEKREELRSMLGELVEQAGLGEVPLDVWLDASGLVRKLALAFSATQPGTTESAEVSMAFELYDYGERVEIELPPAGEVVDQSALSG